MPSLKQLIITLTAVVVAGTASAYAQTDTTAVRTATTPLSEKAVRQQNHQLESKVRHALISTKNLDSSRITILARSGKITLAGNAPNDEQIQQAGTIADDVARVPVVTNNLRVRESGNGN